MVRTDVALESWRTVREDAAQAVEEFPAGDFDFKPAEGMLSFREIATHILEAGYILASCLADGVEDLSGGKLKGLISAYQAQLPPTYTERDGLIAALRGSVGECSERLSGKDDEFWATKIIRFDGQQVTRLELLLFIKEHELQHRSQLFVYLRLKGLTPPTTRRRLAAQKAANQT